MLGCNCRREILKRRSMARPWRASSSWSTSNSMVAATLRFRAADSARVVSIWRLITFLSGFENESVIFQQRDGIGHEFVQAWIAQLERRLRTPRRLLLAQNVGHIIGAECAGRSCLLDGGGYGLGTILPDQFQQFR